MAGPGLVIGCASNNVIPVPYSKMLYLCMRRASDNAESSRCRCSTIPNCAVYVSLTLAPSPRPTCAPCCISPLQHMSLAHCMRPLLHAPLAAHVPYYMCPLLHGMCRLIAVCARCSISLCKDPLLSASTYWRTATMSLPTSFAAVIPWG